ncbi:endonuclease domain-containing protein [Sphingomonas sp. RS2018]
MILPGTGRGTAPAGRGGGGVPQMLRPEVALARRLRRDMSYPEVLLWRHLRGGATGSRFRRGHPIGPYVADFYCAAARLVVEIDGEVHAQPDAIGHDRVRDRFLADNGYRLIRVPAADVLRDAHAVADAIGALAARPLHRPSDGPPPRAGED